MLGYTDYYKPWASTNFMSVNLAWLKYGCKNSKWLCKKIYQKREKKCVQKIFDVVSGGYVIRLCIVANKMRSIQDDLVMELFLMKTREYICRMELHDLGGKQ